MDTKQYIRTVGNVCFLIVILLICSAIVMNIQLGTAMKYQIVVYVAEIVMGLLALGVLGFYGSEVMGITAQDIENAKP